LRAHRVALGARGRANLDREFTALSRRGSPRLVYSAPRRL
jgi:hypothetical protein